MECKRCKSKNVNAQVTTETNFKQGRGCIGLIFFTIPYLILWIVKWSIKIMIYAVYSLSIGLIFRVIALINKRDYQQPDWLRSMMQRRGRAYSTQKTMIVCQDCGYTTQG